MAANRDSRGGKDLTISLTALVSAARGVIDASSSQPEPPQNDESVDDRLRGLFPSTRGGKMRPASAATTSTPVASSSNVGIQQRIQQPSHSRKRFSYSSKPIHKKNNVLKYRKMYF